MKNFIVTEDIYKSLAEQVLRKIEGRQQFSLTIEEIDYDLQLNAIVYYSPFRPATYYQPSEGGDITDIVPIWWEFHTYDEDREEIPNDFEFKKLHEYLV